MAWQAEQGETSEFNLYDGCTHHHHVKHNAPGWTVTQHRDGKLTWTTPTGHSYTSDPYDYRCEDEPDLDGTGRVLTDAEVTAGFVQKSQRPSVREDPTPPPPAVPADFILESASRPIDPNVPVDFGDDPPPF